MSTERVTKMEDLRVDGKFEYKCINYTDEKISSWGVRDDYEVRGDRAE